MIGTQQHSARRVLIAAIITAAMAIAAPGPVSSQQPTAGWQPNFTPLGLYCFKGSQNVNVPAARQHEFPLSGGCGCENTQFRWTDGELYIMESHGHKCDPIFAGYNSSVEGDCTYFRIRHMLSGRIVANVSESLRHSFFSAVVDYSAKPSPRLWVFGPAHARGNRLRPGPCDGNSNWRGCYIGSWSSTDLTTWSPVSKAVLIPTHHAAFNTRATMVASVSPAAPSVLPKHQAAMVLEPRSDHAFRNTSFRYAINTGPAMVDIAANLLTTLSQLSTTAHSSHSVASRLQAPTET
eukprot:SAG31_NODE_4047_length_3638_cov_1.867477_1_plen_293_part_00